MARLAGKFAGILLVDVDDDKLTPSSPTCSPSTNRGCMSRSSEPVSPTNQPNATRCASTSLAGRRPPGDRRGNRPPCPREASASTS